MSVNAVEISVDPYNPVYTEGNTDRFEVTFPTIDDAYKVIHQFEELTQNKYIVFFKTKGSKSVFFDENDRIPYTVVQRVKLECQHGPDRNKAFNAKRKAGKVMKNKTYIRAQSSIKVGCTADIRIVEAIKYPDFQAPTLSKSHRDSMSFELRRALLSNNTCLSKESTCKVFFPRPEAHHGHALGQVFERGNGVLDSRLVAKIEELAIQGVLSLKEIQHQLRKYVLEVIFLNKQAPSKSYRRFFPTRKIICQQYIQACIKLNKIQVEGNKLTLFVDDWENTTTSSNDNVFHTYISIAESEKLVEGDVKEGPIKVNPCITSLVEAYSNHVAIPQEWIIEEPPESNQEEELPTDTVITRIKNSLAKMEETTGIENYVEELQEIESRVNDVLTRVELQAEKLPEKRVKTLAHSDDRPGKTPKLELHIDTSPLPTFRRSASHVKRRITPKLA